METNMNTLYSLFLVLFIASSVLYPVDMLAYDRSASRADDVRDRVDEMLEGRFVDRQIIVKYVGTDDFEVQAVSRGQSVRDRLVELNSNPRVEYAEPDYVAEAYHTPNDTYYNLQWNFENSQSSGDIHMKEAWDITRGAGATVAVVDTGVAFENYGPYLVAPDLADTQFVQGFDFINYDSHANDDNGHGTHVAGTIAQSTDNSYGTAGIAPDARIMPVKVLAANGGGSYSAVANGIKFAADNGADVINMSLGGSSSSATLENAVRYAYERGVVIFAASGNDGRRRVGYPAAYDEYVIAIGATDYDERKTSYSNYGDELDFVAPGGDTGDDDNDDGQPDGILQQTLYQTSSGADVDRFGFYFYQGTSMATPHAAGAAALLVSIGVTDPDTIENYLRTSAEDLDDSGWDKRYGWGLINAHKALVQAGGTVDPPEPEPEPEPDPEPVDDLPAVNITSPGDNSTVSGTVSFTANASDDSSVASVRFFIDGTSVKNDTSSPYNYSWDTTGEAAGQHVLRTVATDSAGQTAEDTHTVTVDNPEPEPTLPDVVISSLSVNNPRDGSTLRIKPTLDNRTNNDLIVQVVIELFDPSGSQLSWIASTPFTEEIDARDDDRITYRATVPRRTPELSGYLARVTLMYDGSVVDTSERTFRVR